METLETAVETIKIVHDSELGYRYVNATDLTPDMVIYGEKAVAPAISEGVQEEGSDLPPVAPVAKKKAAAKG